MSITAVRATQLSRTAVEVAFDADPSTLGFSIGRFVNVDPVKPLAELTGGLEVLLDATLGGLLIGDLVSYAVDDLDAPGSPVVSNILTVNDPDVPYTNAPPDPAAETPRYTDLVTLKRRLRIDASNTDFDEDLTEAIVACEISIDYELGQSFPSTGTNPQYGTVPFSIRSLATAAAVAVYKAADTPFGVAGSDDYFGALSVADVASQTIRRSPLLRGLQISFGVS